MSYKNTRIPVRYPDPDGIDKREIIYGTPVGMFLIIDDGFKYFSRGINELIRR